MNYIRHILKESKIVRVCLLPYMRINLYLKKILYKNSDDAKRIRKYKDLYKGKSCFIIGNGPSLCENDLERIKNMITFSSNGIYEIFEKTSWRPTYYLCVDPIYILNHKKNIDEKVHSIKFISNRLKIKFNDPKIEKIFEYNKFCINKWNDKTAKISEDISQYFSVGYTVTFTAIQLAIYMGFKNIYLLGIDYKYPILRNSKGKIVINNQVSAVHFYKDSTSENRYNIFNYESSLYAYKIAKDYADHNGINILNATRGGNLEVFTRVDFDEIVDKLED